jgi:hypothetical protein
MYIYIYIHTHIHTHMHTHRLLKLVKQISQNEKYVCALWVRGVKGRALVKSHSNPDNETANVSQRSEDDVHIATFEEGTAVLDALQGFSVLHNSGPPWYTQVCAVCMYVFMCAYKCMCVFAFSNAVKMSFTLQRLRKVQLFRSVAGVFGVA